MKKLTLISVCLIMCSILQAQNVGINTNNPTEQLHIRTDSSKLAIRLDNKKSTEGFNLESSVGLPSNVNQVTFDSRRADWTDLNPTKLGASDDTYLNGPMLDTAAGVANGVSFNLDFAAPIPNDAIIQNMRILMEWTLQGSEDGFVHIYPKLFNGNDRVVNYQRQDINTFEDVQFVSYGVPDSLFDEISIADINSGNLRLQIDGMHEHYLINDDSVRVRFDQIALQVEYAIPALGNENVSWSTGVDEGNFLITNSEDLGQNTFLRIDENGTTRLKELQITDGAKAGHIFTCNNEGLGYWASPSDLGLDQSETNELQIIDISNNKLGLFRPVEKEDTTIWKPFSFVELDSMNYWGLNDADVFRDTGEVGIGLINPEATIHMRRDTQDVFTRMDNRKSALTGTVETSIVCLPSSLSQTSLGDSYVDWPNLDVNALLASDDSYLNSAILSDTDFAMQTLQMFVSPIEDIPTNATITDIKLIIETKKTGGGSFGYFISRGLFLRHNNSLLKFYSDYDARYVKHNQDKTSSSYGYSYSAFNNLTPAQINNEELYIEYLYPIRIGNQPIQLNIDHLRLKVEYTIPATGAENVTWTTGVHDGKFTVSLGDSLTSEPMLKVDESGTTRLRALQISEDAGAGKVLTSTNNGKAYWSELPEIDFDSTWFRYEDTIAYDFGPVKSKKLLVCEDTLDAFIRFDNIHQANSITEASSIGLPSNGSQSGPGTSWLSSDVTALQSSDDQYFQSGSLNGAGVSKQLLLEFDFNESIPTDATIDRVKLVIERNSDLGLIHIPYFFLYNGAAVPGNIISRYLGGLDPSNTIDKTYVNYGFNYPSFSQITATDINNGDLKLVIYPAHSHAGSPEQLNIDLLQLVVEYSYPLEEDVPTVWTAGVNNGKFKVSNGNHPGQNTLFSIGKDGVTRMKGLKIQDDASAGKVLTSSDDGTAYWSTLTDVQLLDSTWQRLGDTTVYSFGPVKIDNSNNTALVFDGGKTSLKNNSNLIQTDRQWMNILLDANNDQTNTRFAIYNDSDDGSGKGAVQFHLDDGDSWVNGGGDFGVNEDAPDTDLHLVHGTDFSSDGFKIERSSTANFWRFYTASSNNLNLYNTNSPTTALGVFNGTTGAYTTPSDIRLKKNIMPINGFLDNVLKLEPVKYHFKSQNENATQTLGLIAQDVQKLFPEVVMYDKEQDAYTMDYSLFGVLSIQAIKEQQSLIDQQNALIQDLIQRVEKLEKGK